MGSDTKHAMVLQTGSVTPHKHTASRNCGHKLTRWGHEITRMNQVPSLDPNTMCPFSPLLSTSAESGRQKFSWSGLAALRASSSSSFSVKQTTQLLSSWLPACMQTHKGAHSKMHEDETCESPLRYCYDH